ncbi:MAG: hypothetical protein IPF96_06185 [Rhodobacter sp.]|nr:hypothetical protein [Rhodobacter sp.]
MLNDPGPMLSSPLRGWGNERRISGLVGRQPACLVTTMRDLADQIILFLDDLITTRFKFLVILDGFRQVERLSFFADPMLY